MEELALYLSSQYGFQFPVGTSHTLTVHCIRTAWAFNSPRLKTPILISACEGENRERSGKDSSPCESQSRPEQLHRLPEVSALHRNSPSALTVAQSVQGCFSQKSPGEEKLGSPSAFYWFQWEADPCPPSCAPRGDPAVAGGALEGGSRLLPTSPPSCRRQGDLACPPHQDVAAPAGAKRDKGDVHIHNWKWKTRSFAQLYEQMEFSVDSGGFHCRDL